jgi:hypothetical protein
MVDGWGRRPTRLTARWPSPRLGATWEDRVKLPLDDIPAAWADWVGCVPWRVMLTLTFDAKKRFRACREMASREAWDWLDNILSWTYRKQAPTWLYSVERGRSGSWHVHVLVTDISALDDAEVLSAVLTLWENRNGLTHLTRVSGTQSATLYVTKGTPYWSEVVPAPNIDKFRSLFGQGRQVVRVVDGPCPCPEGGGKAGCEATIR